MSKNIKGVKPVDNKVLQKKKKRLLISLGIVGVIFVIACIWYAVNNPEGLCDRKHDVCGPFVYDPIEFIASAMFVALIALVLALIQNRREIRTGKIVSPARKIFNYTALIILILPLSYALVRGVILQLFVVLLFGV